MSSAMPVSSWKVAHAANVLQQRPQAAPPRPPRGIQQIRRRWPQRAPAATRSAPRHGPVRRPSRRSPETSSASASARISTAQPSQYWPRTRHRETPRARSPACGTTTPSQYPDDLSRPVAGVAAHRPHVRVENSPWRDTQRVPSSQSLQIRESAWRCRPTQPGIFRNSLLRRLHRLVSSVPDVVRIYGNFQ